MLPAFLNQREKGQDTEAKLVVTTAAQAMVIWQSEHDTFAGATPAALVQIEPSLDGARGDAGTRHRRTTRSRVTIPSETGGEFTLERTADGQTVRTCTRHGQGLCKADLDADGNRW